MRTSGNVVANNAGYPLLLALLCAPCAHAATVRCHIIYGGENFVVDAGPTTQPYRVAGRKIGRYFEFKASYVATPERAAAINLYTYSVVSGEPVLIHQSKHRPPFVADGPRYGFTGLHSVYEPSKHSELQYWCERVP